MLTFERPTRVEGQSTYTDLLCTAEVLAERLTAALASGEWLDAYLFTCGLWQMVDDRRHPDHFQVHQAASYLAGSRSRPVRVATRVAKAAASAIDLYPTPRILRAASSELADLAVRLAAVVLDQTMPASSIEPPPSLHHVVAALGDEVVRLPAGMSGFDQHPDDVRWLTDAYLLRHPSPGAPVCVVGVRTSGCYLGPLHVAALQAAGVPDVDLLTFRPNRPFHRHERDRLRAVARSGGRVIISDDPPGSGSSIAKTAVAVGECGLDQDAITLLVSLFAGDEDVPPGLRRWETVVQPWRDWSVHRRLQAEAVKGALSRMLGSNVVVAGMRSAAVPAASDPRAHARARYFVELIGRGNGEGGHLDLLVEGAGLGYFGRNALAIAEGLVGQVPAVFGFEDGLLYREFVPGSEAVPDSSALPGVIARYVASRNRALSTSSDPTPRLRGRFPIWEVTSTQLAQPFGPAAPAAQVLLYDTVAKRLLRPERPGIVDGKTDWRHWRADPASDGARRKVDFHHRAFCHLEGLSYDPVFDLAGAAAEAPSLAFERRLREEYEIETGEQIDGERWLLYRLAQLNRMHRAGDLSSSSLAQHSARAVHDYLAAVLLSDVSPASGPLCAIDLDGVLETDRFAFAAASPSAVLALRALKAHGYRPVLATGRSVTDVIDRCVAFDLVGGVAEYGTCYFHRDTESVVDLRTRDDRQLLARARFDLEELPGVRLDPGYRFAIRAATAQGALPRRLLDDATYVGGPGLSVIAGEGQTDITVSSLDKAAGLRALADHLGTTGWALAVGDTASDLPMLRAADLARAPANADPVVRGEGIQLTRHGYQTGLSEACADLIGHRPGGCPLCRPAPLSRRTRLILAALAVPEPGGGGLLAHTARVALLSLIPTATDQGKRHA